MVTVPTPGLVCEVRTGGQNAPAVVVLHGSGGDETSLLGFALGACPDRTVVAVRGRIPWEGGFAFFARRPDRTLDDADLALGAAALQRLLLRLQEEGNGRPVLLGYSNGAVLAAAALALDHRLTSAAALLRPLSPQPEQPFPTLDGHPVLLVSGADDHRRDPRDGPRLEAQLRAAGATTTSRVLPGGHPLTPTDEALVRAWLVGLGEDPGTALPRR